MEMSTIVGSAAAIASTASFLPQAIKIIKSRDTDSISGAMYAVSVGGCALWARYGVMLVSWPLIVENLVCLVLSGFILVMKALPQHKKEKVADAFDPNA